MPDRHDPDDKPYWVEKYKEKEILFVEEICPRIGIKNATINPEKKWNKYAPDLLIGKHLADLKYQGAPFFRAMRFYGTSSQFTVSFNEKDYLRYKKYYPHIGVFFWIEWTTTSEYYSGVNYTVSPMWGVWGSQLALIDWLIRKYPSRKHEYINRKDDNQGNAKTSYGLDLRDLRCFYKSERSTYLDDLLYYNKV